jgi:thiol reductant ABC exporter CydC subunit
VTRLIRLVRLIGPYRWQVVLAVVLGAATVGGGIGLMGAAAFLIATAALHPSIAELQVAIVGVRFFGLSRGVFRYFERLVSHDLTLRLLGRFRLWFFRALEPLAPAKTIELRSADLLTRAVSDVEVLQELYLRALAPPLVAVAVAVSAAAVIGLQAVEPALVFAAAYTATAVLVPAGVMRMGRRTGLTLAAANTALAQAVADSVQGMADLLALGGGGAAGERVAKLSLRAEMSRERAARREALGGAGVTFGTHATVWMVLVAAIPLVGEGGFTGVDLAVVCLVAMAAFEAVQPLPAAARGLADQLAAAGRLFAVIDEKPVVVDPDRPEAPGPGAHLEIDDVTFTYPGGDVAALSNLSLGIPRGAKLAVVGPSGAGKSSLVHLLLRFWDPARGEIRLGRRPLSAMALEDLRSVIGVLPQRTELFTGTIRDNLALAAPDAGEDELDAAADRAGLSETIRALPDGWQTWIGEHGRQLSGGQRARLALARLVLRDPEIIVLDEPTTGLDPVTERRVMEALFELFERRTMVVITHRLVAMDRFDEIVVLDRGRICEQGTHSDLVNAGGLYAALIEAQESVL